MNPVSAALQRAAEDLRQLGHPWALVGGLAVSAHRDKQLQASFEEMLREPCGRSPSD